MADGPLGPTDLASKLKELKPRVYWHLSTMKGLLAVGLLSSLAAGSTGLTATADGVLPADFGTGETEQSLSSPPSKHWVWINDIVFAHMVDGTAHLIDGDSGKYHHDLRWGHAAGSRGDCNSREALLKFAENGQRRAHRR
jgi:hypothetical protein